MGFGNPMAMHWGVLYKGTAAEKSLEDAVAKLGVPYRTQFPGYLYGFRYFPDFLLPTLGLVIEVDDDSHGRTAKVLADADRTDYFMTEHGWKVVRCTNEEALQDPHGTVKRLMQEAGCWPVPQSTPRLAESLPRPKKAAAKEKRRAKAEQKEIKRKVKAKKPPKPPMKSILDL